MSRTAWTLVVLIAAGPAVAQEPGIPTRKLTVSPAAAPVPALRYKLLPDLRDTTPGNAALLYYRAFSPEWWSGVRTNKELEAKVDEAVDKSPAEVKAAGIGEFIPTNALKEVDRAARRSYCDWELTPRVREEGISLLIPDVQELRRFARYLKLRAKLELADERFDEAVYTLQTGMQLGRHAAHGPTLIQALVGVAITAVMCQDVEDWIQIPHSPNLYWALTDLPAPFIDLHMPLQGEKLFIDSMFPGYREALADPSKVPPPITTEQQRRFGETMNAVGQDAIGISLAIALKNYAAAKTYLREHGRTAEQVDALPVLSAVFLDEIAEYDRLYDEMLKGQRLPYPAARTLFDRADQRLKEEVARAGSPVLSIAGLLMPAIRRVMFAQVRTERNITMLRVVEALRLHAASHGSLPDKLADITDVPVPVNPVTGKSFEYKRDGDTAVLSDPPQGKDPQSISNALRYEITLRK